MDSEYNRHTLNSASNEKKYAEILLHYRLLFIKGNVFIGEWGIFGTEVFLHYSWFFVKGNFVIGGVECTIPMQPNKRVTYLRRLGEAPWGTNGLK